MRARLVLALVPLLVAAGCMAPSPGGDAAPSAADDSAPPSGGPGGAPTIDGKPPAKQPDAPAPCADPAGCLPPTPSGARVIAAVIDSGINPYHDDFSGGRPAAPGAAPLALTLHGDYAEAVGADQAVWSSVEVGKLYSFPGTRIVGAISMGKLGTATAPSSSLLLDDVGHGTAAASALARNAPHVDIVMVQVGAASLTEGIAWAAAQPWIDILSVSWGTVGNVPLVADVAEATKAATDSGKIVVVAAGNEPTAAPLGMSGPTWVVSVGGSSPDGKGETWTAAKGVDVVSDFSPELARHDDTSATEENYGTSFAAPTVAGALAEAWYLARAGGFAVEASALRTAMNGVATYFAPTDYQPNTLEVPVLLPCAQQGWGYVDGTMAEAIFRIATGASAAAVKGAEVQACMDLVYAARGAWWG